MKQQNRIAFLNILSTLVLNGISFFTAPLFSRMLGDSGYGVLSVYTIWTGVVAIVFTLQSYGTLVNARVEYSEEEQKKYQSSVMFLSTLVFLVCSVPVLLLISPLSQILKFPRYLIYLMLLQAFGSFCVNFLSTKFIYEFKAGWKMILSLGVTLATLVLSVVLILQMPDELRYVGRILAISATYGLIGIPICIFILLKGKTFYNPTYWKFCLYLAIPTVCYGLSDLLLGQSDRVMLQQMLSEAMVGQYSLALNFGGILFTIFGALNHTWCPFFFDDMKQGRQDALQQRSKNFLELFTVLSSGFVLLETEVYHVFASRDFWSGTVLIPVFAASYFINFLCTFPVNYEYYRKKTKVVAIVTVSSALVNVGLNYLLIRRMGIMGAALATCISHGLQLGIHYFYNRHVLGKEAYPFRVALWGWYAVAFAGVVVLVWLTPNAWWLRWPLGAAVGFWEILRIRKRGVLI